MANSIIEIPSISQIGDMLAPVQRNLVALYNYGKGMSFIYNGVMYQTTTEIALGSNIIIGTNCQKASHIEYELWKKGKSVKIAQVTLNNRSATFSESLEGFSSVRLIMVVEMNNRYYTMTELTFSVDTMNAEQWVALNWWNSYTLRWADVVINKNNNTVTIDEGDNFGSIDVVGTR